jgi:DNA-binding response OmpR family regulator
MKKILLVEGAMPLEGLSGSLFRRRECVLEVASSAAEALQASETSRPDLVLYDSRVRDMAPTEFVTAMRSLAGPPIPIIAFVDSGDERGRSALTKAGASAVDERPADEIALNARMCELLGISLRRHLRTFVKIKVDATYGGTTHFATISNISLGGVLVDSEKPIAMGEIIKLSFFLPGDDVPITVIGKVVRQANPDLHAYGCEFLDLSDQQLQRIHEFVTAAEGDPVA